MDFKIKEYTKLLDLLWGRLFTYNHALMKRSEDKKHYGSESFTDVIDFYLTSQAQCFIKDLLLNHVGSPGMLLSARCFLEGLALKRMYQHGKISDWQVALLRHQVFLIEYKYYKDFDDIADKILIPEKLIRDKEEAVKFFKEQLSSRFNNKQISAIIKSDKPFLCDPNTNYRKLVEENLGEEYAQIYGIYSQAIHPSVNDFYMNEGVWQSIPNILILILEEYKALSPAKLTFNDYYTSIYESNISQNFKDLINQECKILIDTSNVFKQYFDKNYTSNTLTTMNLLLKEMYSDKLLGLCEQIKSKWKIILDMSASFYYNYVKYFPREEHFKLLEEHECVQLNRNINQKYSVEQAYTFYKILYPNGINKTAFEKPFLTLCGYTVDENGKVKKLTDIAKEFIKQLRNPNAEVSWDRSMLLDYVESQMLSHANGYMWYANSGAWGDTNNIIVGTDICIMFILESILTIYKTHKVVENTNHYRPIINIVRNSIKRLKAICAQKVTILQIPGIVI